MNNETVKKRIANALAVVVISTLVYALLRPAGFDRLRDIPAKLHKLDPDPFTDEFDVVLSAIGRSGELSLLAKCVDVNPYTYSLNFYFVDQESKAAFVTKETGSLSGEYGNAEYRFDNGPIESFRFRTMPLDGLSLDHLTKEGNRIRSGDPVVKRFPLHRRLRVNVRAKNDEYPSRRVVEDFDILDVDDEMLKNLCVCAVNPSHCIAE